MAGETDLPKYWNEETGEVVETYPENTAALMPQEEVLPLPTISEQTEIVQAAEVNKDNMNMLNSLVEMNKVAETLNALRSTESQEMRRNVLTAWCESFVNSRMINNVAAEKLKARILDKLSENIEVLDLETQARIFSDLHEVTAVDMQQANSLVTGNIGGFSQSNGTTVNLNLATGENGVITSQTLNATPQQVGQLKEVTQMNTAIKGWSNVQLPRKKATDTEFELQPKEK
jgi:hypothetical protein